MRLILILLTALSLPAFGQVYKWTDADGNVHFGTQPPPGYQEEVNIRDAKIGTVAPSVTPEPPEQEAQSPREKLDGLERAAGQRACDLAKSKLASAERKFTLALSIDQKSPMVGYRENQIDLWKRRVRIECTGVE
jgi:hypothetical protein